MPGGPLKSLACFASTVQLDVPAVQGARATTVASTAWPGCTARLRNRTVPPVTVAVPGTGTEADTTVKPAGTVTSADPSCCEALAGTAKCAVKVDWVPAATVPGVIVSEYGFDAAGAEAAVRARSSRPSVVVIALRTPALGIAGNLDLAGILPRGGGRRGAGERRPPVGAPRRSGDRTRGRSRKASPGNGPRQGSRTAPLPGAPGETAGAGVAGRPRAGGPAGPAVPARRPSRSRGLRARMRRTRRSAEALLEQVLALLGALAALALRAAEELGELAVAVALGVLHVCSSRSTLLRHCSVNQMML